MVKVARLSMIPGVALLAVALVGCGSDGGGRTVPTSAPSAVASSTAASPSASSGGASTPTSTATATATVTVPAGSVSSSPNPGGSSSGGTVVCTPTVSRFSVEQGVGAGGHFGFSVHVVNASQQPCVTTGYPGVALLDGSGRQVLQAQRTPYGYIGGLPAGASPAQITLQPGQEATALIEGVNYDQDRQGASCNVSARLLFTLPDNTDSTTLTHRTIECPGLQVHPLVPGSSGNQRN